MSEMARSGWQSFLSAVKEVISEFIEDDSFAQAAALSFYTMLSLVPLLMIVIGVAAMVWGEEAAAGQLADQMGRMVGPRAAELIQTIIANAGKTHEGPFAVVVGVVTLLVGATSALAQLKAALEHVWEVPTDTRSNALWRLLRTRLLAVVVVLTAGVLLLASFVATAFIATAQRSLALPLSYVWEWISQLLTVAGVVILLVVIYRFLPSARISWPSVWVGAISTSLFFFVGRSVIARYVSWSGVGSAFGATGSLVALLLWIYYSSLSLFLGAEVAQVWGKRAGRPIVPSFSSPARRGDAAARRGDGPRRTESYHRGP